MHADARADLIGARFAGIGARTNVAQFDRFDRADVFNESGKHRADIPRLRNPVQIVRIRDVLQFLHGLNACGSRGRARLFSREPGEFGREEHAHFIHNSGGQGGGIQNCARFEQDAENFAAAKFGDGFGEVGFRAASGEAHDFNSGAAQGARFRGIFFRASEDERRLRPLSAPASSAAAGASANPSRRAAVFSCAGGRCGR